MNTNSWYENEYLLSYKNKKKFQDGYSRLKTAEHVTYSKILETISRDEREKV